jgi:hypothetical protein
MNVIRKIVCKFPLLSYATAKYFYNSRNDYTRNCVCKNKKLAYKYAVNIDKCATNETRTASCESPEYAYKYAVNVDKCATNETRTAACKSPQYAYLYAINVDKSLSLEVKKAVKNTNYENKLYLFSKKFLFNSKKVKVENEIYVTVNDLLSYHIVKLSTLRHNKYFEYVKIYKLVRDEVRGRPKTFVLGIAYVLNERLVSCDLPEETKETVYNLLNYRKEETNCDK